MKNKDPKVNDLMKSLSSNAPAPEGTEESTAIAKLDTSIMFRAMCEKQGIELPGNFHGRSRPVPEHIKIISEAAIFEMPDGSKRDYVTGNVAWFTTPRTYWESEEAVIPKCTSAWSDFPDASILEPQGENCLTCKLAQFGSGKNNSQACTASVRLFFLIDGNEERIPYIITLPPTSIKVWDLYLTKLERANKTYLEVMTTITLRKEKGAGFNYSIAILKAEDIGEYYNDDVSKIQPRLNEVVRLLKEVKEMKVEITRENETPAETTGEVIEETQDEA